MALETVLIERMALGGRGVGRLPSGKVVLARGAAPGDRLRVRIDRHERDLAHATAMEIVEPAADRVAPPCPSASRCGGCSWMHIDPGAQRRLRRRLVVDELTRGGLAPPAPAGDHPDTATLGYRTRTRLHRRGARFGTLAAGSHEVVPLVACPVLAPPLEALALELAGAISTTPPADAEMELWLDRRGRRALHVLPRGHADWRWLGERLALDAFAIGRPRPRREARPPAMLEEDSAGEPLLFAPGVFVQVNREVNALLVAEVLRLAGEGERFAEAYAGAGNFTIHLAPRFASGLALEGDALAAGMLRENLAARDGDVRVHEERDDASAARLARGPAPDVFVADPPRAGMKPLVPAILSAQPPRVVVVSCHPAAAVRDAALLAREGGYALGDVTLLDMFPQTHHVEIVLAMERASG